MNTQKGSMGIEIIYQQALKQENSGKLVYNQLNSIIFWAKTDKARKPTTLKAKALYTNQFERFVGARKLII